MNCKQTERDVEVYKAFLLAQDKGETIAEVGKRFNLTRGGVYDVIKRIKAGNPQRLHECLALAREECLWEHKYSAQYAVLQSKRGVHSVNALKDLIKDMYTDGFSEVAIAKRLSLARSTVRYHLNK